MGKKSRKRDVDILALMRKRGDIDDAGFEAGRLFQQHFSDAGCALRGLDYDRTGGSGSPSSPTESSVMMGQSVFRAIDRLGGPDSPCGKAAWEVIGEGRNVAEWSASMGVGRGEAKGILIACVSLLARHYGFE